MKTAVMIGVVGGAVGIAAAGGGAAYMMKASGPSPEELRIAQEAAAHERFVREEEINYATLFSYVRGGSGGSQPVMVTLHLAGTNGLGKFCRQQPLVEEAVLRSLAAEGTRARLADAVNGVLDGRPVRNATARPIGNQTAAAAAGRDTETKCRKLLKG